MYSLSVFMKTHIQLIPVHKVDRQKMKLRTLLIIVAGLSGTFAACPSYDLNNITAFKDGQTSFSDSASNSSSPLGFIAHQAANFSNVSNFQEWFLPADQRQQLSDYSLFNSSTLQLPYFVSDSLRSAAEQYTSILNTSLSQGFAQTQKSFAQLNEMAITAIQLSNNVIAMELVDIQSRLSRYSDNVRTCVDQRAGGYRDVLPIARDTAVDCVFRKYRRGLSIIVGTRNDTFDALEGGRQLGERVSDCATKESFPDVPCILAAIANINQKTILLPVQMTKRFAEATEYVATIKSDMMNCGVRVIDAVAEQSLNVTQAIATCLVANASR